ncbi:MAG: hypothetical protein NXH73_07705, partial [Flavobacteriaceae bacterium]|nr:hypothetical protein [Flavobacteriaceae bacterium]
LDYLWVIQNKTTPANTSLIVSQSTFYFFRHLKNFVFEGSKNKKPDSYSLPGLCLMWVILDSNQ